MPLWYHKGDAFGFNYNGEEYYYIKNVQYVIENGYFIILPMNYILNANQQQMLTLNIQVIVDLMCIFQQKYWKF
ncbi:MAG: hypothetical protein ACLUML_08655 [Acutalibacteraceae bacterium]